MDMATAKHYDTAKEYQEAEAEGIHRTWTAICHNCGAVLTMQYPQREDAIKRFRHRGWFIKGMKWYCRAERKTK